MDDLINVFVDSNYTVEAAEDIYQALGLFRTFNYLDPFPLIDDMLMMESYQETTAMTDTLTQLILNAQAYILDQHGIVLTDETTLSFNNVILRALFQLQRLEDRGPTLSILESMEGKDVKFAEIVAQFSEIPVPSFLQVIQEIRPVFLKNLASYLYSEEENSQRATEDLPIIVEKIRLFKAVFGINPAVRMILDVGTVMGEPFKVYLPLYDDMRSIIEDEAILVEVLMFLLLYSSDGVMNPLETYQANADFLVRDLSVSDRLGKTIGEMSNKMQRHKESQVEKA